MTSRDMLTDPCFREADLGCPLPDSAHAVSVALPSWAHVVGYEERDPAVIQKMQLGYPRFVIHPYVKKLADRLAGSPNALPMLSPALAERCADYVTARSGESAEVLETGDICAVRTTEKGHEALMAFWQHTGQIVSSRHAEALLNARPPAPEHVAARERLRNGLAALYQCAPEDVFLFTTGMAAIDAAVQALNALNPGLPTAQVGFPYVDSLKVQNEFGKGARLIVEDCPDMKTLRSHHAREPLAGCFCEVPSNPLLRTPDVAGLSRYLREQGIPLVLDDVVATPYNVNLMPYADLIATSLTKYIAGSGDVMGGALICSAQSPMYTPLQALIRNGYEDLLWGDDVLVLDAQLDGFADRMQRHNRGGALIAERLQEHPAVSRVWYPKWITPEAYDTVRRPAGGWSSLMSFTLKGGEASARRFYDALQLCKGPTLGTVFTLACPYALLAHYRELEWAESCGVPRDLIRVSIGIEDPDLLWSRFDAALNALV